MCVCVWRERERERESKCNLYSSLTHKWKTIPSWVLFYAFTVSFACRVSLDLRRASRSSASAILCCTRITIEKGGGNVGGGVVHASNKPNAQILKAMPHRSCQEAHLLQALDLNGPLSQVLAYYCASLMRRKREKEKWSEMRFENTILYFVGSCNIYIYIYIYIESFTHYCC